MSDTALGSRVASKSRRAETKLLRAAADTITMLITRAYVSIAACGWIARVLRSYRDLATSHFFLNYGI
jgi:hypothetical protein